MITEIAQPWADYELLDSGNGRRLERFGAYVTSRPDSNVLWKPTFPERWKPDAMFDQDGWQTDVGNLMSGWELAYQSLRLAVRPTPFRHVGIFPEQRVNWDWLALLCQERPRLRVLNLFAYTGIASLIAAKEGAQVCHVDASTASINWAKENARLSGLADDAIRWISDDALKFMAREVRRGRQYDVILMDPPVFGRGPKGEIFRLEERLSELVSLAGQLLASDSSAFLLNFYATALYPESVLRLAQSVLGEILPNLELYSLVLQETWSENRLPTGFFLRS